MGNIEQTLSPYSINGVVLDLKGQMGIYSEWYQYNPYSIIDWMPFNTLVLDDYNSNNPWQKTRWSVPKGGWTKYQEISGCQ